MSVSFFLSYCFFYIPYKEINWNFSALDLLFHNIYFFKRIGISTLPWVNFVGYFFLGSFKSLCLLPVAVGVHSHNYLLPKWDIYSWTAMKNYHFCLQDKSFFNFKKTLSKKVRMRFSRTQPKEYMIFFCYQFSFWFMFIFVKM